MKAVQGKTQMRFSLSQVELSKLILFEDPNPNTDKHTTD